MENFNAEEARRLVAGLITNELNNVLSDVRILAGEGKRVSHVYKALDQGTIDELEDRGFVVVKQSSIAIQKDGLYYSINW